MVVAYSDMERFIHAVQVSGNLRYFLPSEITPSMIGKKVRIVDGPLRSYEGNLLSLRGTKKKRLLVSIPNFMAVGVEVQSEFIQFI